MTSLWLRGVRKSPATPCSVCVNLELKDEKFFVDDHIEDAHKAQYDNRFRKGRSTGKFGISSGSGKLSLGTLEVIRLRSPLCPFCRLVVHSVESHPTTRNYETFNESAECFVSWDIDGREAVRDAAGNIVSKKARTRRIRLHWPGNESLDAFIVLVAHDSWGSRGLFFGRHVASAADSPSMVRRWLELCHNSHGPPCRVERGKEFENMISKAFFGVIDVDLMCLTSLPPGGRYVALSYIWGDGKPYKTDIANAQSHYIKGGIQAIVGKLPRVIQDAISLVQAIGERYLWIDSMCIIQDSPTSWDLNSQLMDIVYGAAHLTICAADGEDAGAGLQGISPSKRIFTQHIEAYDLGSAPSIDLMVSYPAEAFIRQSKWNTRAWTFQERMLSKRCLIFVGGRIYFQCQTTTMCEDIVSEDPNAGWSLELVQAPTQKLAELSIRPIQFYATSVELYTSRQLRFENDILSAFNGIGNLMGKTLAANMIYGLPSSHFDWALLWETRETDPKILSIKHREPGKFPSWAWCGWIGSQMTYKHATVAGTLINLHEWLMEHTWIVWYIRDGHGSLRLVWDGRRKSTSNKPVKSRWQGYSYPEAMGLHTTSTTSLDPYGRCIQIESFDKPVLPYSEFNLPLMPEYPYGVNIETSGSSPYIQFPDLPYLQFYTWSAHLRLTLIEDSVKFRKLRRYGITDHKGDWCGTIVLDPGALRYHSAGVNYEFVAISEAKDFSPEEYDGWAYYIPKEREQSEWDLYYVLLIEVDKLRISRRLGLGKVFKEAFENSYEPGKMWKEFILG